MSKITGIRLLWAFLALSPLALLVVDGLHPRAAIAGLLWIVGGLLIQIALRRDPEAEAPTLLMRSRSGLALALLALAAGPMGALLLSGSNQIVLLLASVDGLLLLWALRPTPERLTAAVARVVLLGGLSLGLFAIGEVVCRLPAFVAYSGGTRDARRAWSNENYDGIWEQNVFGLRSLHVESTPSDEMLRIVTIGDSYTWGDRIARTQDIWPYVLEESLRARGSAVQVVNLARNGHSLVNHAETLRRLAWRFDPDILVLQIYLNDPLPSGPGFQAEQADWIMTSRPLVPFLHRDLERTSYLYAFLDRRFRSLQYALLHPEGYGPLFEDDFEGWRAARRALAEIAESARARGVPVQAVLFPSFVDLGAEDYPYMELHRKLVAACREAELPVLDLRPRFAEVDPDGSHWWVLPWDTHPGVEAHRYAAAWIEQALRERGLLGE